MNTQPPLAPSSTLSKDERNWAMWAHLSALAGLLIPLGNLLGPFIVLMAKRDQSTFVAAQARAALNFNLTVCLVGIVCGILIVVVIGAILLGLLMIFWLIMVVLAAIRANEGAAFRYPFTLQFLR